MFPTKKRIIIRGCQAHIKAGLGCATDYVARYVTLYAPFDGEVVTYSGRQGGNWLRLVRLNGDWIEMAHLNKYLIYKGEVKEGRRIAVTGNTGSVTTGPHLHIQIKNKDGERVDPESYSWDTPNMATDWKVKYEKEVEDHKESIQQKNLNYNNWQNSIEMLHDSQEELLESQALLESIRNLLD